MVAATLAPTEMMRGDEALPPIVGVIGFEPNPATTPLGNPDTLRLTGELKLIREFTITVAVPDEP